MSWQRVRTEFESMLALEPSARELRLRELATTDRVLADRVRELLGHDDGAGRFLERAVALSGPAVAAGQRIGRFQLVRPLGSGGMGAVWEAEQLDPRRRVALKLAVHSARSAEDRWRFQHEVQVLADLQHPAIATFYEAGTDMLGGSEVSWLAMELVDEATDVLTWADTRALDPTARLALFDRLCEAVGFGHRRGVLHRDLKPANVLVGADGQLKLIDFGIARALGDEGVAGSMRTRTGEIVGTLQFMAPEQLRGQSGAITAACDVWALGVILYHLLCGRAPFELAGRPVAEIVGIVLDREPLAPTVARPGLSADLASILGKALEKDAGRRYATVEALQADLARYRAHEPVLARPAGWAYRARKYVRRHRVGVGVAAAVACGLGIAMWGLWAGAEQARRGEQLANAGRAAAERGELVAKRSDAISREALRITVSLFEGIDETERSRDLKVHELLDAAVFDERTIEEPRVEQAVREVRGDAYMRLGFAAKAREEYERATVLQAAVEAATSDPAERATATAHGCVLSARLGYALVYTGERERGDSMMRDALDAVTAAGSELQRDRVLNTFCQYLGIENLDAELVERARELLVLADRRGDAHAQLTANRWLAKALGSLQRHDEAKTVAATAWEQAKQVLGPQHRLTIGAYASYVTVLQEAGDLDAAERHYPPLIEQVRAVYGPTHRSLLTTLNNRAHLLHVRGRKDEALAALREVVAVHEALGGPMTVEHLQARHNVGQVLNMAGRCAEAEPMLAEVATASRELLGPDDPDGAKMRFNHAVCLTALGRFAEAEPALLAEYAVLERMLPAGHDVVTRSRRTIADAYRRNGKPERAAQWQPR